MKFQVKFRSDGCGSIFAGGEEKCGLNCVDFIRHETGVSDLELDRIGWSVNWNTHYSYVVDVSEDFARQHYDLFAKVNQAVVNVDGKFDDSYYVPTVYVNRNNETGEIVHAEMWYVVSDSYLLSQWEAAGCPAEWNVSEGGEDES